MGRLRSILLNIEKTQDIISSNLLVSYQRYTDELERSKFCLCPPKTTIWTYRLFESIAAGCIPVLYDDGDEELPFADVIDYASFTIRIKRDDAKSTARILRAVPDATVAAMQKSLHMVAPYVSMQKWGFHLVLYELYTQQRHLKGAPTEPQPHFATLPSRTDSPTRAPSAFPTDSPSSAPSAAAQPTHLPK